jgi:YVTN family beta-propeller protein
VVDGISNTVLTNIRAGSQPAALVYNPANNKIYSANSGDGSVSIIDGNADSVITNVTVGGTPVALAYNSANNKIYWGTYTYDGKVAVIDGTTNQIVKTITVGGNPSVLFYQPTNNKIYCINSWSSVSVISGVLDTVITMIGVGRSPTAFTYYPEQNRIYVANSSSGTISVIRDEIPGIEESNTLNAISLTPEIYPNPAKSFLAVRLPLSTDRQAIKIFDVSGKLIKVLDKVTRAQSHKQEVRISLIGINPGIYFLKVGKETKKFIVAK